MPNQGAIVATGAIRDTGAGRVMTITSTYDHRVIQGAESGSFLRQLDGLLAGAGDFYSDVFSALAADFAKAPPVEEPPRARGEGRRATARRHLGQRPQGGGGGGGAGAGVSVLRAPGRQARSAGQPAARRPGAGPRAVGPRPRDHGADSRPLLRVDVPGETLAEALPACEPRCGTIAYEVEHLASHEERLWLRRVIESNEHRRALNVHEQRALLQRLTQVEARALPAGLPGPEALQHRGLDVMVPALDQVLTDAAEAGAHEAVIGMAHRGRLNVLAHIVGVTYEAILAEFEAGAAGAARQKGGSDDVKYHLGAEGTFRTPDGTELSVTLSPNPSHLEAVNPVVEGRARAQQSDRRTPVVAVDRHRTLPILIHGDAAFAAQGVVAETFNMARLAGYTTGGSIHIIANNQIGFTTGPTEGRSTTYSSDLAKGFDAPIIHVNADDPEATLAAARLAMMYRQRSTPTW